MEKTFTDGKWEGEGEMPPEITDAEIKFYDKRADELARQKNVSKVHVVVQINPDTLERTVCYLQEPNYPTKISVMDKSMTIGLYFAADELRQATTIKEASDPITYGEGSESDRYKLGIVDHCINMVTRLQNQFKKK